MKRDYNKPVRYFIMPYVSPKGGVRFKIRALYAGPRGKLHGIKDIACDIRTERLADEWLQRWMRE